MMPEVFQGRRFLAAGAALGFIGVALGAFGAHGLQNKIDPTFFSAFEVGVRYQMYHALTLLVLGVLENQEASAWFRRAGLYFFLGTIVFSSSLYLLALTGIQMFGMATPVGGILLLAGWLCCLKGFLKR